jgi:hypothetical protein
MTWWADLPDIGAMTNNGDRHHLHGTRIGPEIRDPVRVLIARKLGIGVRSKSWAARASLSHVAAC